MSSGCKMVKCPRCNYENPPEAALVKGLKKLFARKKPRVATDDNSPK